VSKVVTYFLALWALIAVIGISSYLFKPENRLFLAGLSLLVLAIVIAVVRGRSRRKHGYFVYRRGGAEDGVLVYNERGKSLQFYFNRIDNAIYIPSHAEWKRTMPDWATERKDEIVSRIKKLVGKRLIGKSWSYEETDKKEHLINQA
jgi:hypothetical protein